MEQKKTLWIIAAVGAFLLVVLGAAGIMYSPAKNPSPTIASVSPVDKGLINTNTGWTNTTTNDQLPLELPQDITTKTNDLVVLADNATVYEADKKTSSNETTIDLNSLKNELSSESQAQNINITLTIPETQSEQKYEDKEIGAFMYDNRCSFSIICSIVYPIFGKLGTWGLCFRC